MIPTYLSAIAPALANHLWQSTLFAVVAAILMLAFKTNQARVRYHLWLAASLKFLIPFSLLIGLGGHLAKPRSALSVQNGLYSIVEGINQPFTQTATSAAGLSSRATKTSHPWLPEVLATIWLCGFIATLSQWWLRWRRVAEATRSAIPISQSREVDALRGVERVIGVRKPIALLLSPTSVEPGIVGVVRPVLLWPAGISDRLDDAHLRAILVHEVWHVRRRDNLAAAIHMLVEATFWFHPLVWWLGARLIEERERACDEEVLQLGSKPLVYAESILKTCEFCVGSPLPCVSAVTGSDLKNRIVRIMADRVALKLDLSRKLLLVVAGLMAVAVPTLFGLIYTTQSRAELRTENTSDKLPAYEVASIKPDNSGPNMMRVMFTADGLSATNIPLKMLIQDAYGMEENQIVGAPNWVSSERYDIEAKVDGPDVPTLHKLSLDQRKRMMQPVLADRFRLQVHSETRELPVYELVVSKSGSKLHEAKPGDTYPNGIKGHDGASGAGLVIMEVGQLTCQAATIDTLTHLLSGRLGHNVLDKTGLTGRYDFKMQWPAEEGPAPMLNGAEGGQQGNAPPPESSGPSIFTAVQELGLRLESHRAPVDVLVIDHIERPSAN